MPSEILGIDIGGSGIKFAPVDIAQGQLLSSVQSSPISVETTLSEISESFKGILEQCRWQGPVGIGYPGVIRSGVALSAANVSKEWLGVNLKDFFGKIAPGELEVINDADAAGLAEMAFGSGQDHNHPEGGSVLMLTLGTGIGSAFFYRGQLFPNTEFGHVYLSGGIEAEALAAASIRMRENLTWEVWAERLNVFLREMEKLVSPELIILGGGVTENFDRFRHLLEAGAEIRPAKMGNDAGIIGAALAVG